MYPQQQAYTSQPDHGYLSNPANVQDHRQALTTFAERYPDETLTPSEGKQSITFLRPFVKPNVTPNPSKEHILPSVEEDTYDVKINPRQTQPISVLPSSQSERYPPPVHPTSRVFAHSRHEETVPNQIRQFDGNHDHYLRKRSRSPVIAGDFGTKAFIPINNPETRTLVRRRHSGLVDGNQYEETPQVVSMQPLSPSDNVSFDRPKRYLLSRSNPMAGSAEHSTRVIPLPAKHSYPSLLFDDPRQIPFAASKSSNPSDQDDLKTRSLGIAPARQVLLRSGATHLEYAPRSIHQGEARPQVGHERLHEPVDAQQVVYLPRNRAGKEELKYSRELYRANSPNMVLKRADDTHNRPNEVPDERYYAYDRSRAWASERGPPVKWVQHATERQVWDPFTI